MKKFINESMFEILNCLQNELENSDVIKFKAVNPSLGKDLYSGELIEDKNYMYHSFKSWSDLAEVLFCRLNVIDVNQDFIIFEFSKLKKEDSFHLNKDLKNEKYGSESIFFRINKNEESSFLNSYLNALKNIKIENKKNILNLGINKGDEFDLIEKLISKDLVNEINFYGVDYSQSAIEYSKNRFNKENFHFFCHDINELSKLNLPKMDTLISIGTLQSSSLNFKTLFMDIYQNCLEDNASIILGFPNCRWIDGEMVYGAKVPNYNYSEQSILFNDVMFCKKYLQQKKYRVTITGKNYIFLTATSIK